MQHPSTRQAGLDARILRQRRIGQRLLDAPETYTALAQRPGRALLGGAVASLVIALVVAVVAAAGAARTARRGGEQPRRPPASVTTAAPATGPVPGGSGPLPVVVSVSPAAAACRVGEAGIEMIPLFTEDEVLGRVELDGFPPGCVGRELRLSVLGVDGAELASRGFVLQGPGPRSVSLRSEPPLRRAALGRLVLEIR